MEYANDYWNIVVPRHTITLDANGGTVSPTSVENAEIYALPTPTREGYKFTGWTTDSGLSVKNGDELVIKGNHTLTTQWELATYTITLDYNDGTGTTEEITVTYGGTYEGLTTPTREGYNFLGWFDAAEGGNKVTIEDAVTTTANGQTLYAHWQIKTYYISFERNEGDYKVSYLTSSGASGNTSHGFRVNHGDNVSITIIGISPNLIQEVTVDGRIVFDRNSGAARFGYSLVSVTKDYTITVDTVEDD